MKSGISILIILTLVAAGIAVWALPSKSDGTEIEQQVDNTFKKYWYGGEAELNSYTLDQARYGEMRKGEAVLIFVTEDFSKSKQVKLDRPQNHEKDAVSVLKMNATRKFFTGIYPYSIMQSVFTPVDQEMNPGTIKTSFSSQEWCGHVWSQLNKTDQGFRHMMQSYFESEGDATTSLNNALLEDEIFNQVRLNPAQIQEGSVDIIPSSTHLRLRHIPIQVEKAEISKFKGGQVDTIFVNYTNLDRSVKIFYQSTFPHIIEGWEEKTVSGWAEDKQMLTTRASRKKTIKAAYWTLNGNDDQMWRDKLDLN